jgi:peptidoglycan/xylan/chitin deacetylase (PgdA/CDA1 family)
MVEDACARQEIEDSKKAIESLTGVDCRHFAYPHGRYNSVVIEAVRNAGFPYAYTTDEGLATSRSRDLMIPRNGIDSAVSFFDFKSIVRIGRISRKRLKHHIL